MELLTDFIIEYRDVLSQDLCAEIIQRFDSDSRPAPGLTFGGPVGEWKKSTDLNISHFLGEWEDIDQKLFDALSPVLQDYISTISNENKNYGLLNNIIDTGYQIQRTDTSQYYKWHSDYGVAGSPTEGFIKYRHFTYLFYLNDNFEGGHTQFFGGDDHDIIPETGKLLMFPANPIWIHQGQEVTRGSKYVITGWIMSNIECPLVPWYILCIAFVPWRKY